MYLAEAAKPGDAVRIANGQVFLAATGDGPCAGILAEKAGYSLDDTLPIGTKVQIYPKGLKQKLWIKRTNEVSNLQQGRELALSSVDGEVRLKPYTDSVEATDSQLEVVGIYDSGDVHAGHASDMQLIPAIV
jgi:hypothetical protein